MPGPEMSLEGLQAAGSSGGPDAVAPRDLPRDGAPAPQHAQHMPLQGQIARHLAEPLRTGADGRFDLHLSPEELGRVRMTVHHGEHGVQVQISADRPETMDLIRRHLPDLDRDLRGLGHSQVGFSFSDSPRQRPDPGAQARALSDPGGEAPEGSMGLAPQRRQPAAIRAGLDIRL